MKTYFLLAFGVACVGVAFVCGVRAEQKEDLQALMRKKLQSTQQVLEGLALNGFDKISKHAAELSRISQAAEFRVLKTPQYEVYSNEFRRSVETMDQVAKLKNGDGVALAYVNLTLACVQCHKHVREVRMTSR